MTDWISDPKVSRAVKLLKQQAVIAYPTESVWGLGCDPWSREAVEKLLHLKKRSVTKGLILIAADSAQLKPFLKGWRLNSWRAFTRRRRSLLLGLYQTMVLRPSGLVVAMIRWRCE